MVWKDEKTIILIVFCLQIKVPFYKKRRDRIA